MGSFLFSVVLSNPASIGNLPGIPDRLLLLSGVSASGYLGGKLARKAGPILDEILLDADHSQLTVFGSNLDVSASFELDGVSVTPFLAPDKSGLPRFEIVTPPGATDFAKTLRLHLVKWDPSWLDPSKSSLTLTIVNQDGQRAAWPFPIDPEQRKKLTPPSPPGIP